MRLISTYDRIKAADDRCNEIVKELAALPEMEYCAKNERNLTRSLNQEYLWSAQFIINQCGYIIESEEYSEDYDFQIKMSNFQKRYEDILEHINNHSGNV